MSTLNKKPNTWINRIYNSDNNARYDLSKEFDFGEHSPADGIPIDLSRTPIKSPAVSPGDTVYIAVQGILTLANGKLLKSTRIVAKGIVEDVAHRANGVPYITFVKGTFMHLATPLIDGLDLKLFANYKKIKVTSRRPYFSIGNNHAKFIDDWLFYNSPTK